MLCMFRFSRRLTLVSAVIALLVSLAACGKKDASLAARKATVAARNAELVESATRSTPGATAKPPELVGDRDVGAIVTRGLFSPLVRPETPSARIEPEWAQPGMEGIPITFLESGPEMPTPGAPTGPGGPEGSGGSSRPALGEASSCQLAITGVVSDLNGYRLLVRHIPSGQSRWVQVGEDAFGYRIELVTLRGALVTKDDRYYVLPLGQNAGKTESGPSQDGARPSPGADESVSQSNEASEGDARFHGTWSGSFMNGQVPVTISFREDHSGSASVMGTSDSFTWRTDGALLHTTGGGGGPQSLSFRFEDGDRALVLSGGQMPGEVRLNKQ